MTETEAPPAELTELAARGDRRSVGRLLSLVERGGAGADEVTELTYPLTRGAHVVGITGAPGSGKSTLTGHLIRLLADSGRRPAVLAVDPSSPLTGGAILGDRIRMDGLAQGGAFIRSMATRGHQGGLALAVPGAIRVYDACGFDPIIVETVGVGQVEVDVAGTADTTVVVVTPDMGDAVQANKAGLLEVADVFVVNKSDRPGASDTRRDIELMLDLSHMTGQEAASGFRPEIVLTTATEGTGAGAVLATVESHLAHLRAQGELDGRRSARLRQEVRDRVEHLVSDLIDTHIDVGTGAGELADAAGRVRSPAAAARRIADQVLDPSLRRRITQ